ncbi:MAG: hypothetical protein HQL74_13945 [Magnetococcales bacterium]|nr:hypothetical protein [Magnetococcales bacterium]
MTNIERFDLLTKKMVSIWDWCCKDDATVRQQEAERIRDKKEWNRRISDLEKQL